MGGIAGPSGLKADRVQATAPVASTAEARATRPALAPKTMSGGGCPPGGLRWWVCPAAAVTLQGRDGLCQC